MIRFLKMMAYPVLGCSLVMGADGEMSAGGPAKENRPVQSPQARNLCDFKCADGKAPDGLDNKRDDTAALVAAMSAGPGIVHIGPGHYRFGAVAIPAKVSVVGSGRATIIRSNGAKRIFSQAGVGEWALKDLALDGETTAEVYKVTDKGRQGLYAEKCYDFTIQNVAAMRFEGVAIEFYQTDRQAAAFCNGGTISGLTLYNNYAGISFSERAEYMTSTQIKSYRNVYGCIIHGGNISIADSHFCMNETGIYIEEKENDSHGSVSNCLINHNTKYAVHARGVQNGHNFIGCSIFYGMIKLIDCRGIKIASGTIACDLVVEGESANLIIGNYIVPSHMDTCTLAPSTIVRDNFDDTGSFSFGSVSGSGL